MFFKYDWNENRSETDVMPQGPLQDQTLFSDREMKEFAGKTRSLRKVRRDFPRGGFGDFDALDLQVLVSVAELAPTSPTKAAENISVEQNSVSESIAKLTERGLMSAVADPDDKRRKLLAVTDQGAALLREQESSL